MGFGLLIGLRGITVYVDQTYGVRKKRTYSRELCGYMECIFKSRTHPMTGRVIGGSSKVMDCFRSLSYVHNGTIQSYGWRQRLSD
ncbi:hypothetical protein D3C78_1350280 [compost metagenome]